MRQKSLDFLKKIFDIFENGKTKPGSDGTYL